MSHHPALQTLSISSCVLLGWWNERAPALADVLPPNINTLRLVDDCAWYEGLELEEEDLMASLRSFVAHGRWRTTTQHLRNMEISYKEWEGKTELQDLCEQNGVACTITRSA
ncbi:hypothetical protein CC86DRAFT_91037 [Ophiobolus disseminans]|uniref:Uncharacterized protein n=1 Tax=Ophiobolus disseminans TaxID=1469910 RepID=A0A6A7AGY4_9PLEO|nr:hypothetical protein CC86DRAFT_91037 [Ophiobolus disseminans]